MVRPSYHSEMEQMITRGCRTIDQQTKGFLYLLKAVEGSEEDINGAHCKTAAQRLQFLENKSQTDSDLLQLRYTLASKLHGLEFNLTKENWEFLDRIFNKGLNFTKE